MADIGELNLKIRVNPDTGQLQIFSDAVDQLQGQVKDLTQESEGLNSSFTRPLENVGVHIFGHELLDSMGIASTARPVLQLLRVGIMEVGESFGAAATAAMPYVFGLAAVAAVIYKAVEAHKAHEEAINQTLDAMKTSIGETSDLNDKLDAYKIAVGGLPGPLQELASANKALLTAQKALYEIELTEKLKDLSLEREKQATALKNVATGADAAGAAMLDRYAPGTQQAADATGVLTKASSEADVALKSLDAQIKVITATQTALKSGAADVGKFLDEGIASANKYKQIAQNLSDAEDELRARTKDLFVETSSSASEMIRKVVAEEETGLTKTKELNAQLVEDTRSEYEKKDAVIDDFLLKEQESTKRHYDQLEQDAQKAGLNITTFEQQRAAQNTAIDDLVAQKRKQNLDVWSQEAKNASDAVVSGFAEGCARSIVEGKNLEDELKNAFKSIAEQVIADLIRIEIQAAITAAAVRAVKTAAIAA